MFPPTADSEAHFCEPRLRSRLETTVLRNDPKFNQSVAANGIPWGVVLGILKEALPETMEDRDQRAKDLVPVAVSRILGEQNKAWKAERRTAKNGKQVLFIFKMKN